MMRCETGGGRGPGAWRAAAVAGVLLAAGPVAMAPARPAAAQTVGAEAAGAAPLTLAEAAAAAVAGHPSLGAARAEFEGAEAAADEARADFLPSLAAEAGWTRFELPMVVAPFHGFDPTNPPAFDDRLVQGHLTAAWTVFDGGARGARLRRARALAAAAGVGREAAEAALLAEVARAYLRVSGASELLRAHGARVAALARERERADRLLAQGRAARVLLLRAEAALGSARAESVAAAAEAGVAERDLARLMGVDAGSLAGRSLAPVRAAAGPPPDRAAVLARAREFSPDLLRARSRRRAAEAGEAVARSAWLPRLRASGRYVEYGTSDGAFQGEWQAGLQLSLPLFTGGARASAAARARAEARFAGEQARLAELNVTRGVDRAWAAFESAAARASALEATAEQAAEVARIERLALEAGAGVQTDYLAAEADLFRARAALTAARHEEIAARVELARVAGELDLGWLAANLEMGR